MKYFFPFIILLSVCVSASAQTKEWERVGAVSFTGIARQSSSKIVLTTSHGYLYSSTNEGSTWDRKKVDDTLNLVDVAFVDSLHGVILEHYEHVLFTSDGGNSWKYSNIPLSGQLNHIAYTSINTAFVCDSLGNIWQTSNRGDSWNRQYHSNPEYSPDSALSHIFFLDSQVGFVTGLHGIFLTTVDGGVHWNKKEIGAGDSIPLSGIDFFNKNVGVVCGYKYFYTTTNGGVTWKTHTQPDNATYYLNVVKLISDHEFFGFAPSGQVYYSANLGDTVGVSLIVGNVEAFSTIYTGLFTPGKGAFVAGNAGLIASSLDGRNWTAKNQCTGGIMESLGKGLVHAISEDAPFFVTSTDGGITWNGDYTKTLFFVGLHFTSLDSGFVIQETGDCIQTTNNGKTWAPLNLGLSSFPKQFTYTSFNKYNVGYAVSEKSVVRTSDNGVSWLRVDPVLSHQTPYAGLSSPLFWTFLSVQSLDKQNGFATMSIGDSVFHPTGGQARYGNYHSTLYHTINAGTTWEIMEQAPQLPRSQVVYFKNIQDGFLSCDNGVLYRTVNGGNTWNRVSVGTSTLPINAINFLNDTVGFLASRDQMYSTKDGGNTWAKEIIKLPSDFPSPSFVSFVFPDSNSVIVADNSRFFYRREITGGGTNTVRTEKSSGILQYLYISAFPNPSRGTLQCILHGMYSAPNGVLRAGLFDILGREVIDLTSLAIANNNNQISTFSINTEKLSHGVYTIEYSLNGVSYSKKIAIY